MTVPINWDAIPAELANRPQWLLWRFEKDPKNPERKKLLKVPYWITGTPRSGTQGSDKDRSRLTVLSNVRRVFERANKGAQERPYGSETPQGEWEGIGFAFLPDDGLIGVDIDGAIDGETGEMRDRDRVIIEVCASYTEYSPSGLGIHIIVKGATRTNKFDPIQLEVFCGSQFFTFTGRRYSGSPADVNAIEEHVLAGLHKEIDDAKEQARIAKALTDSLLSKPKPAAKRSAQPEGGSRVDDFKRVNEAAMANLDAWVPSLFPGARKSGGKYRITSRQLGRELEEDLSIDPRGIKDFGVHDMGDAREGGRTPIDLVLEWLPAKSAKDALAWLAARVGIELTPFKPERPKGARAAGPSRRADPPAAPPPGGPPDEPPDGAGADGEPPEEEGRDWFLLRARKTGDPLDCRENVLYALKHDAALKGLVAQNMFTELHERTRRAPWGREAGEWDEEDDLMLGEYLANKYLLLSRATTTLRAGVQMAARLNRYNPVHDLIRSEPWDGKDRLETWLVDAFEVKDRPYVRLIGKLFIMGMVQRALRPGCKFDYMLILKGEQGLQKSTAFRVLAEPWFTDNAIQMGNKESLMTMQLVWLAESAELESMNKAETTAIKQFLSAQEDTFRPPYGARMLKRPRHAVNVGTTNADTFLKDATGDRRFWPLEILVVHLDRIRAMRTQLFAEALHRIEAGERYYPTREEEKTLVFPEQEQFKVTDVWTDILAGYVHRTTNPAGQVAEEPPARRAWFSTQELFDRALNIKPDRIDGNRNMENRIGNCMRALGWTRFRERKGAYQRWGYLRPGCKYGEPVPGAPPPPPPAPGVPEEPVRRVESFAPGMSREPGEDDDVPV